MNLRGAASTVFALTGILPLLLFAYAAWRLDVMSSTEVQVALLLAVGVALLGFVLFQRLTHRITGFARALGQAAVGAPAAPPTTAAVPGFGQVIEIGELAQVFSRTAADFRASMERLEDLVFKLGTLNEMVELAAKIPEVQGLLSHVLDRTMRAVSATVGSVMLLDRDRQVLKIAVSRGLQDRVREGAEVKVGDGIAGRVVALGEPVLVEDIETDPRFGRPNDPRYGSGSFICMPLRVGDRIVGVVNLARKEIGIGGPSAFSRTDLQFLNTLVTYTAYAVENARLFEEAQQAARRLREVVEDQQLRLTLAQQQMIQAAKLSALGELVAGVAHELNNPLTILVTAQELLAKKARPEVQGYVGMIRDATAMARRVVQGLLTFSRKMPLERRRVDLQELLDKVLALTGADLRIAGVTIERSPGPELPPVWADPGQLQQVLLNLVTNAKQAMAEVEGERRLRVSIRPAAEERVEILVEDTGPGIPAEVLPKVFDPFMTTKGSGGTGLGLSISYGIVREHGGELRVESEPGRGARFTVELPVGHGAEEPDPPAPAEAPAAAVAGGA